MWERMSHRRPLLSTINVPGRKKNKMIRYRERLSSTLKPKVPWKLNLVVAFYPRRGDFFELLSLFLCSPHIFC